MVKPARVSEKENQKTRHRNINHQQNDNNVHTRDLREGGGGVLSVDWENRDHPARCTMHNRASDARTAVLGPSQHALDPAKLRSLSHRDLQRQYTRGKQGFRMFFIRLNVFQRLVTM